MDLTDRKPQRVLEDALAAFQRTTGLEGRVMTLEPPADVGWRPDALVEFNDGIRWHRFVAEIKTADRVATLGLVKTQLEQRHEPGLLIATYMTQELAENCRRLQLNFIDTAGNAYVKAPGLTVFVIGQKRPLTERKPTFRAFNATGLRVLFVLLCKPRLLGAPYRDIQKAARVALGTVGWVLNDLRDRGYILGDEQLGGRRFTDMRRLADQWVEHYPLTLRPKLEGRRFQALDHAWWQHLRPAEFRAYWGGEVAANKLTAHLRPERFTIYAREGITKLVLDNRLEADVNGDIEILEAFWDLGLEPNNPDVVPPLLAYADLMATLDPRNHEAARLIYDRYIAPTVGQT